jgi:hypothetical protein
MKEGISMSFCPYRGSHSHGMPSEEERKQIVDGAWQCHTQRIVVLCGLSSDPAVEQFDTQYSNTPFNKTEQAPDAYTFKGMRRFGRTAHRLIMGYGIRRLAGNGMNAA